MVHGVRSSTGVYELLFLAVQVELCTCFIWAFSL
jgi:hypothetical protein